MEKVIDELVQVNLLRYTLDSYTVTWHSKMVKEAVKKWVDKQKDEKVDR